MRRRTKGKKSKKSKKKTKKKKDKKSKKNKTKKKKKKKKKSKNETEDASEEESESKKRSKKRKRDSDSDVSEHEPPQKKRKLLKAKKEEEEDKSPQSILDDMIDVMTGEKIVNPTISPFGHVMEYSSWCSILRNPRTKNKCPFTKKSVTRRSLIKLNADNIEEYKEKIVNITAADMEKFKTTSS
eukprot:156784_1